MLAAIVGAFGFALVMVSLHLFDRARTLDDIFGASVVMTCSAIVLGSFAHFA